MVDKWPKSGSRYRAALSQLGWTQRQVKWNTVAWCHFQTQSCGKCPEPNQGAQIANRDPARNDKYIMDQAQTSFIRPNLGFSEEFVERRLHGKFAFEFLTNPIMRLIYFIFGWAGEQTPPYDVPLERFIERFIATCSTTDEKRRIRFMYRVVEDWLANGDKAFARRRHGIRKRKPSRPSDPYNKLRLSQKNMYERALEFIEHPEATTERFGLPGGTHEQIEDLLTRAPGARVFHEALRRALKTGNWANAHNSTPRYKPLPLRAKARNTVLNPIAGQAYEERLKLAAQRRDDWWEDLKEQSIADANEPGFNGDTDQKIAQPKTFVIYLDKHAIDMTEQQLTDEAVVDCIELGVRPSTLTWKIGDKAIGETEFPISVQQLNQYHRLFLQKYPPRAAVEPQA